MAAAFAARTRAASEAGRHGGTACQRPNVTGEKGSNVCYHSQSWRQTW